LRQFKWNDRNIGPLRREEGLSRSERRSNSSEADQGAFHVPLKPCARKETVPHVPQVDLMIDSEVWI
jgi:hypothetical protein